MTAGDLLRGLPAPFGAAFVERRCCVCGRVRPAFLAGAWWRVNGFWYCGCVRRRGVAEVLRHG